jgi:hypothetical protein
VRAIVEGGKTFGEALRDMRLEPALDRLVIFARLVTPRILRRRYDARFFLAELPPDQEVRPQEGEVTDFVWTTPDGALSNPSITMVYATRSVLESVAADKDAAKLFSRARQLKEIPIVEPKVVRTENGWEIERD